MMRSRWFLFLTFFALGALQYALAPNALEYFRATAAPRPAIAFSEEEKSEDRKQGPTDPVADVEVSTSKQGGEYAPIEPQPLLFAERAETAETAAENEYFPLADDEISASELAQCSNWARFPVGSWARRRTTGISYENSKPVQSVTETKITLKSVDMNAKRYTLEFESTIKLGIVDYPRKSETATYDFWDVPVDESTKTEDLPPVGLTIGSKTIPCRVRRIVRETQKTRETTTLWYSPVVAPYVLQREMIRDPLSKDAVSESAPARELYVVQRCEANFVERVDRANYVARSTSVSGRRRRSTTTVYSGAIPGGALRENVVESRFGSSATVFQTDSVLLDYYIAR